MVKSLTLHRYRAIILLLLAMFCIPSPALSAAPVTPKESEPFLTAVTSNAEPFAGQELLVTYTLSFQGDAPKIVQESTPALQGLWAKESPPARFIKSTQKTIHGESFRSAVVKQFTVVPLQSGTVTIAGYRMQCTLPSRNGVITIAAPAIPIKARPLPDPVPEGFSGAVGTFTLELIADKQTLSTGEPITLQLKLAGTGSLQTLQLPALLLPDNVRHNPAELKLVLNAASSLSSGTLTSTVIAWPQAAGSVQIPAVSLIVFNPETAAFTMLHTKPLIITVNGAPALSPTKEALQSREQQENQNGTFSLWWMILIVIMALLIGAALVLSRKLRQKQRSNGGGTTDVTQKNITSATSIEQAKAMKQQIFASIAEKGIQKSEALTRKELLDALRQLNIPPEAIPSIAATLDGLDHILYHPLTKNTQMLEIEHNVQALLKVLRQAHHAS